MWERARSRRLANAIPAKTDKVVTARMDDKRCGWAALSLPGRTLSRRQPRESGLARGGDLVSTLSMTRMIAARPCEDQGVWEAYGKRLAVEPAAVAAADVFELAPIDIKAMVS